MSISEHIHVYRSLKKILSQYTSKIYQEFYHGIVYFTNEECHIRIPVYIFFEDDIKF
jgi:hypothetical protein